MIRIALATLLLLAPKMSQAHDAWATGEPVPAWVKSNCCGPKDVHHLAASSVHVMPDGYHIDGLKTVVPMSRALPSMDGDIWAFWNPDNEPEPMIWCFFYPLNGS